MMLFDIYDYITMNWELFAGVGAGYLMYQHVFQKPYILKHRRYDRDIGSFADYVGPQSNYGWTPPHRLKKMSKNKAIFIDRFRRGETQRRRAGIYRIVNWIDNRTKVKFSGLDMTKSMAIVGKKGSGKSEFLFSLLTYSHPNRYLIHDTKGDFTAKFLKNSDILYDPFDERSAVWDIFADGLQNPELISSFVDEYFNSILSNGGNDSGKDNFFVQSATENFEDALNKVITLHKNAPTEEKFQLFIEQIEEFFESAKRGLERSQKDVMHTMKLALKPLKLSAWLIKNGVPTFTIHGFLEKKVGQKLILGNRPDYRRSLTPVFAGFLACFSAVHAGRPDTDTDFTAYFLDEYLTFSQSMSFETMERLHTTIRSKGGWIISAVQYLPIDEKRRQLIMGNIFSIHIFGITDDSTITYLQKAYGEISYLIKEKAEKANYLHHAFLNGLGNKYEHITIIPEKRMRYLGYTPRLKIEDGTEEFIPLDLHDYNKEKYAD